MRHATLSFARVVWALPLGVAIVVAGLGVSASAQQPAAPSPAAAVPVVAAPTIASGTTPVAPGVPYVPGQALAGPAASTAAPGAAATPSSVPEDTNPFSNVKPVDNQALKQELPALEQRLHNMENQMSAIQQVGSAIPADALNAPGGHHAVAGGKPGAPAPIDEETMELEASTFVACVNGQALFRDTDQKPFFVDAKEANQNEAVHRIGGCKH